jgi:hypothetical protein
MTRQQVPVKPWGVRRPTDRRSWGGPLALPNLVTSIQDPVNTPATLAIEVKVCLWEANADPLQSESISAAV